MVVDVVLGVTCGGRSGELLEHSVTHSRSHRDSSYRPMDPTDNLLTRLRLYGSHKHLEPFDRGRKLEGPRRGRRSHGLFIES